MNELLREALKELHPLKGQSGVEDLAKEMTPEELFDDFCKWHGLLGWSRTLREVWDECKVLGRQG